MDTILGLLIGALACAPARADDSGMKTAFVAVEKPWLAQAVLDLPLYSFYLGAPAVRGVAYLPNFAPRMGTRLVYRNLGATVTFSLPIPDSERTRRGDSKQAALLLNSYWRRNAFDMYYQRYRGFYASSPWTELSASKPARYPQIPDAHVLNYGLNWYFALAPDRYSFKAAFDLNEIQTVSGGSWIAHPFYNHLEMSLGSGFVPGSRPEDLPALPNLASGDFHTVGAAVGYGHTQVSGERFINAQVVYGPGIQVQDVRRKDGDRSEVYSLAMKLNLNLAVGWNYPTHVFGAKLLLDSVWARVQETQVTSSLVNAQFFAGARF